jgi:hypothetical protein
VSFRGDKGFPLYMIICQVKNKSIAYRVYIPYMLA